MVAAIVVASVIILTQCFSNHENDSGTSIMVEVSATENEFDKIMNRCCEVMEKRIQLFCEDEPGLDKAKFSIKRTNDNKRIRIDFKNVELGQNQVAHVLKLLQSQGCLQFYETYTFNELSDCFYKANVKLAEKDNPNLEADFKFLYEGPLFDLLKHSFHQPDADRNERLVSA